MPWWHRSIRQFLLPPIKKKRRWDKNFHSLMLPPSLLLSLFLWTSQLRFEKKNGLPTDFPIPPNNKLKSKAAKYHNFAFVGSLREERKSAGGKQGESGTATWQTKCLNFKNCSLKSLLKKRAICSFSWCFCLLSSPVPMSQYSAKLLVFIWRTAQGFLKSKSYRRLFVCRR